MNVVGYSHEADFYKKKIVIIWAKVCDWYSVVSDNLSKKDRFKSDPIDYRLKLVWV